MESEHFISSVFAFDDDGVEAHTCTLLECAVSSGLHEAARADVAKTVSHFAVSR
jgi:hypothetical protein